MGRMKQDELKLLIFLQVNVESMHKLTSCPCWCSVHQSPFCVTLNSFFLLQTVLNTMCGYGMQQLEEKLARQDIFTIGCLDKIVWWAKHNLLLVAGLTAGLLLLEVTLVSVWLQKNLWSHWQQFLIFGVFPWAGLHDSFGCCSDLLDKKRPTATGKKSSSKQIAEEGEPLVSSFCRLWRLIKPFVEKVGDAVFTLWIYRFELWIWGLYSGWTHRCWAPGGSWNTPSCKALKLSFVIFM